eukprot:scaffold66579_cov63-Phaeocystis_antarctica.AAC.1
MDPSRSAGPCPHSYRRSCVCIVTSVGPYMLCKLIPELKWSSTDCVSASPPTRTRVRKAVKPIGCAMHGERERVGQEDRGAAGCAQAGQDDKWEEVKHVVRSHSETKGRREEVCTLDPVQQVDQTPVLHQHTLRLASAARRVDHVRQVVRPHVRRRRRAQAHTNARHLRLRYASRVVQLEHRAAEPPR